MISIGYVNDESALSKLIKDFFSERKEFKILFEANSEKELPSLLMNNKIDFLVLTQMPGGHTTEILRNDFPDVKVIYLGFSKHDIQLPYQEGFYYFFLPGEDQQGIENLRWFLGNKDILKSHVLNKNGSDPRKLLSRTEREIIEKLRLNNDRKKLSDQLHRELDTINKHVTNSLRKTSCHKLEELLDRIEAFETKSNP